MNVALNMFYIEGQFLSVALTGQGLAAASLTGVGTPGDASGARRLTFNDEKLAERFREMLADTVAHIGLFRELLGAAAVAQPRIDLGGPGGPFGQIAARAGFSGALDPYADETSMLLGSFYLAETSCALFRDLTRFVGTTRVLRDAVAPVFTTKAYHAGMVRLNLYRRAVAVPTIMDRANRLSDFRDSLDGADDIDQGLTLGGQINLLPVGTFGGILGRTVGQTFRLLYLGVTTGTSGGFLPNGANGTLVAS